MNDLSELITSVEQALLHGVSRHEVDVAVLQWCAKNNLPVPDKPSIDAAYAECLDRWITAANADNAAVFAYHIRLREHLYQKSHALNDFKTCLAIVKDMAQLQQQYKQTKETVKRKTDRAAKISRLKVVQ